MVYTQTIKQEKEQEFSRLFPELADIAGQWVLIERNIRHGLDRDMIHYQDQTFRYVGIADNVSINPENLGLVDISECYGELSYVKGFAFAQRFSDYNKESWFVPESKIAFDFNDRSKRPFNNGTQTYTHSLITDFKILVGREIVAEYMRHLPRGKDAIVDLEKRLMN